MFRFDRRQRRREAGRGRTDEPRGTVLHGGDRQPAVPRHVVLDEPDRVRGRGDRGDHSGTAAAALLALGEIPPARSLIGPVLARPHDDSLRERARTLLGQISKLQQQR